MASFGASLAKAAGAGLLQYGQFKYQEQLDDKRAARLEQVEALREANLTKRENARMEYEKGQRAEDRALRKTERGEDMALRAKERGEDMQLTREQMAAQDAKWNAQLGQQAHQFNETMGFKRVDDLNGSMDAVYTRSQERLDKLEELRLQAASDPVLSADKKGMAAYLAQIDAAKSGAIEDREASMMSLFEANPALVTQSKYYGGESWKNYEASRKAAAQPGVPSPAEFAGTLDSAAAARNSRVGTEISRSGAEYTLYDSRDRSSPPSIGLLQVNNAMQQGGGGAGQQAPTARPAPAVTAPAVPHFAGSAADLDALIRNPATDQAKRRTLQRIRAQQFPGQ